MKNKVSLLLKLLAGAAALLLIVYGLINAPWGGGSQGELIPWDNQDQYLRIGVDTSSVEITDDKHILSIPQGTPISLSCSYGTAMIRAAGNWDEYSASLQRSDGSSSNLRHGKEWDWTCSLDWAAQSMRFDYHDTSDLYNFMPLLLLTLPLAGIILPLPWIVYRRRRKGLDPRFRVQSREDKRQWFQLQVAPNQVIFWNLLHNQRGTDHRQIQGEELLGAVQRFSRVQLITSSGNFEYRLRAMRQETPHLCLSLLLYLPVALVVPSFILAANDSRVAVIVFCLAMPLFLIMWPGLWLLDMVDAYILANHLKILSARWPHNQTTVDNILLADDNLS